MAIQKQIIDIDLVQQKLENKEFNIGDFQLVEGIIIRIAAAAGNDWLTSSPEVYRCLHAMTQFSSEAMAQLAIRDNERKLT